MVLGVGRGWLGRKRRRVKGWGGVWLGRNGGVLGGEGCGWEEEEEC